MATDLDYDDPIGQRLRELRAPSIDAVPGAAWTGVERHRDARRNRHLIAGFGIAAVVLVLASGGFAVTRSDGGGKHVEVVTPSSVPPPEDPPIFHVLETAETGQLTVAQPGPIAAGAEIEVRLTQLPHKVGDTFNTSISVCFPWADGETCNPSVDARFLGTNGVPTYRLSVPGWVYTAAGLRSCQAIGCRIEMTADDGTRIGTPVLDVVSGPAPKAAASLVSADIAGVVSVALDGLEPDPSYVSYTTSLNLAPGAKPGLHAGWTSICALTDQLLCDGVVSADPPEFDGRAHTIDIATNRLLLTPEGWIDCVKVTCAIAIYRTINVSEGPQGSALSGQELVGIVPYRLPAATPEMETPTMTVTPTENLHNKDVVTVTIRNLPGNVDSIKWRELGGIGECAAKDLRLVDDCSFAIQKTFTELPDNGLRIEYPVRTCYKGPPCYIALMIGNKGYPELARSEPFTVDP